MKQSLLQNLLFIRNNFFYFIFFCFFLTVSFESFSNDNIIIKGNKNISSKTIYSLAPKGIEKLSPDLVDNFQKNLFKTGFFENVLVQIENKKLFITVIENPLVNFFYIEGVEQPNLNNKLIEISKIKENSIFQNFLVKNDLKEISNYLKNLGYLDSKINYKLIKVPNNKVNLFYNIELNNKFKINRIFFIGDKFFKSSTLQDVVFSSEHGWWKFFSNSTTPTESIINYDLSRLKNFYLDNGFYDAQVSSYSVKIIDKKYANITYSINSGNKYFFNDLKIIDQSNFLREKDTFFLKKKLSKLIGNNFSNQDIKNLSEDIIIYLEKNNFNLNVQTKIVKSALDKIDITFLFSDQIEKKIINKISIQGNDITDDFVIRNNLKILEGDILNNSKLNSSIDKIKSKSLFKNVSSEVIPIDDDKVDVKISVQEQPTGDISAGAGAGTSGATISAGINERNFLGRGINLNSNINVGTQKIYGSINYSNPDFRDSGNSLTTSVFVQSNDYENTNYQNKIIGSSISTSYEFFDKVYLNPGLQIDYDSVDVDSDASSLIKKREGDFFTSKIFYNINNKNLNREFNPSDGYTIGIGQSFSVFSDIPFINNRIFGSYYNEFKENFVGSIKYKIESINGIGEDIKFSDRLFVNESNLRGFSDRGIGPKINNDFIGGNYSFYTSFSSTIPNGLPEKWNAITNIFFDTANVWGVDDNSTDDSNKIRSSAGFGLSWISPLGPLSMTYAVPITKSSTDDVENFNFKIGTSF